jgi:hypothetical protein
MSSSDPVIPASSSEVSGFENSMSSHRRVLLRGTARLPTRCASPFRRKKKTHCSISLDRFLWEEERKICATCKCMGSKALVLSNTSSILYYRVIVMSSRPSASLFSSVQHVLFTMYTRASLLTNLFVYAHPLIHSQSPCLDPRRYSDTASDVKAGKRGNGNEDCHFGHPPYHTQVPIPSPENSCMLGHGSHALFLSLGPASYEHKVYLQNVSRAWRGGV